MWHVYRFLHKGAELTPEFPRREIDDSAQGLLQAAMKQMHMSARGFHRILKVSPPSPTWRALTPSARPIGGGGAISPERVRLGQWYRDSDSWLFGDYRESGTRVCNEWDPVFGARHAVATVTHLSSAGHLAPASLGHRAPAGNAGEVSSCGRFLGGRLIPVTSVGRPKSMACRRLAR